MSSSIPLDTNLDGLSFTFNGIPAPIFVIIRGDEFDPPLDFDQANLQMPWGLDIAQGTVEVVARWDTIAKRGQSVAVGSIERQSSKASSPPFQANVAEASPGIYTFQFGPGPAIVQNVSLGDDDVVPGSFAHAEGSLPGLTSQPAAVGGVITIWCNGFGPVNGDVASGDVPAEGAGLLETTKDVKLLIGGVEAEIIGKPVLHPTLVGLNQINAFVPEVAAGNEVSIQIEVDCGDGKVFQSRDDVTIAVRPAP
jgi:uncharacterized protein (TIGR03437 family)